MRVKMTKTQRIDHKSITTIAELDGDASEVMAFLDELGYTAPAPETDETEKQHEPIH